MPDFFPYRDGELHAEAVPVARIAEAVGTPFYLYSAASLSTSYRGFAEAFAPATPLICYAVKANANLAVLRVFARLGAGADVVSEGELRRALAAGVRGYLLKDAPADTLAAAIRTVHAGGRAVAPELALESWSGGADPLSERERPVLRLAGEGKSSADIARQIHLSEGTVRNYLSEAISKLNAGNRVEAFRLARDAGWL